MTIIADAPEPRDLTQSELALLHAQERLSELDGLGIGLCGAHRTGKTSLCERLSERNPAIPFVRTSTKDAAEKYGFDVNNPGSFSDRLGWQEHLLSIYDQTFAEQDGLFFTDRTPLDLAAYLLAEVPTGEIDAGIDQRVKAYVDKCVKMTDRYFAAVVVVQPGIPHVSVPGAPAPNRGYQEKLNALMIGLGHGVARPFYVLDRDMTDFQRRLNAIAEVTSKTFAGYKVLLNTLPRQ